MSTAKLSADAAPTGAPTFRPLWPLSWELENTALPSRGGATSLDQPRAATPEG